ncbi:MAG: glutaredoxin, partial [Firmicutes bacterium]|nr:glutaredoxin [Bacillota bacterium]
DALKKVKEVYNADKVPVMVKDGTVQSIGYLGKG